MSLMNRWINGVRWSSSQTSLVSWLRFDVSSSFIMDSADFHRSVPGLSDDSWEWSNTCAVDQCNECIQLHLNSCDAELAYLWLITDDWLLNNRTSTQLRSFRFFCQTHWSPEAIDDPFVVHIVCLYSALDNHNTNMYMVPTKSWMLYGSDWT